MSSPRRSYILGGIFICLLGAVCFSTKAIFVKMAYRETDIDAVPLLALRMIFSLPFFVVPALLASSKSTNVRFTWQQWTAVALLGCLGYYISSLLDFKGLKHVSAGIERLILFVYPTMVLLLAARLFRIKVNKYQWIAVAITYAGLLLAFLGEIRVEGVYDRDFLLGAGMILGCAFTYALYLVGSGRLIPLVGAAKFNSYAMSFACIAVVVHYLISSDVSLLGLPMPAYSYSLSMALLSTVIPSYLITEGIKRIGSGNAAIVGSVGPISTIVQANLLLDEPISALQIGGTALVLAGVILIGKKN